MVLSLFFFMRNGYDAEKSGKMVLMLDILTMCSDIVDNALVFSQKGETNQLDVLSAPLTAVDKVTKLDLALGDGKEKDVASLTPRRKRGRPRKLQPKIPETPVIVHHQNGGVGPPGISVVEGTPKAKLSMDFHGTIGVIPVKAVDTTGHLKM
nr:hypothetical protein [Tanacetum cinerariifolium]